MRKTRGNYGGRNGGAPSTTPRGRVSKFLGLPAPCGGILRWLINRHGPDLVIVQGGAASGPGPARTISYDGRATQAVAP
jgi:hypothetical protein